MLSFSLSLSCLLAFFSPPVPSRVVAAAALRNCRNKEKDCTDDKASVVSDYRVHLELGFGSECSSDFLHLHRKSQVTSKCMATIIAVRIAPQKDTHTHQSHQTHLSLSLPCINSVCGLA